MHLPRSSDASFGIHTSGNPPSDDELVQRIRSGDANAFETVFRRYYSPLCGFVAAYTRSLAIAEELVQDVLASLWERRRDVELSSSLQSYLYGAARNRALSHERHQEVERRWTEEVVRRQPAGECVDPAALPDSDFYAGELRLVVQRVVSNMPERRRIIYQLSRDRNMTYNEIAEVLGISPKTVEIQIGRALKDIRDGLVAAGWLGS